MIRGGNLVVLMVLVASCGTTGSRRGASDDEDAGPAIGDGDTGGFVPPDTTSPPESDTTPPAGEPDTAEVIPDGAVCVHDQATCVTPDVRKICLSDGSGWLEEPCPPDEKCWAGQCGPLTCTPGQAVAECATPNAGLACNDVGTHYVPKVCGDSLMCYKGLCTNLKCEPSSVSCKGFGAVMTCRADGSAWDITESCEKGGSCYQGKCITACAVDIKASTYRGCEYFAVDLDNIEGGQYEPVALVVSVPTALGDAEVTITDRSTGQPLSAADLKADSMIVAAGALGIFQLPNGHDIEGTGTSMNSFHVKTSVPTTVHQFNPLNGEDVYTNDASLLLPTHVGGKTYYVMSWPMRKDAANTLRGFATIVATEPGQTDVLVTPRSDVVGGGSVGAIPKGQPTHFALTQGEVLNLETDGVEGADLTGSLITASQKVAVFGGHECGNVPLGINACDHLEMQLLPVAAWGSNYVAADFKARSSGDFDVWRILAGATDVVVETYPPQAGYGKFKLSAGAYVTFPSNQHFEVKATGPVLVGHFMIGSSYPGHVKTCEYTGIGDPSATFMVPNEQFLKEYTVLTPPGYMENYLNIVAPAGTWVEIDGQPLTASMNQIGGSSWGIAQQLVAEGVHTVAASGKIGVTAYGYDCDVSYAYPGGLRLLELNKGGAE